MSEPPIIYRINSKATPGPNCMWEINRPDLGFVGSGYIFQVLANNVAAWRKANGLPVGLGFEDDLEQAICAQHPNCCHTEDPRARVTPAAIDLKTIILGSKVMASFVLSGFKTVPVAEAERRASICVGCNYNVNYSKGCSGGLCGELLDIVRKVVPHPTSKDAQLNGCGICKCLLQAAVWIPAKLQVDPMPDHMKTQFEYSAPANCWKKPSNLPSE